MKTLALVVLLTLGSQAANATTLGLRTKEKETKNKFFIGAEGAMLQASTGSLVGYGFRLAFEHAFNPNFALDLSMGQAFGNGGSLVSALYTSFAGTVVYSVIGNIQEVSRQVYMNDQLTYTETAHKKSIFTVGLGMEQMLLNGDSGIYPATGLAAQGNYYFSWGDNPLKAQIKVGSLSAQGQSVLAFFGNLSVKIDFFDF